MSERDDSPSPSICAFCQASLEGVHPGGWCPTCRIAVERSRAGDGLEHSELSYVRRLWRGWMLVLAQVALGIAMIGVVIYFEFAGGYTTAIDQTLTVVTLVFMLVSLVGWWWFSEPDERLSGVHDGRTARAWLRFSIAVYTLTSMPVSVLEVFVFPGLIARHGAVPPALGVLNGSLSVLAGLASLVFLFSELVYIKWISPRMGSSTGHRFASRALRYLRWALWAGVVALLLLLGSVFGFDALVLFAIIPGLAFSGLFLATALYHLVLLFIVWRRLRAIYSAKLDEQLIPRR